MIISTSASGNLQITPELFYAIDAHAELTSKLLVATLNEMGIDGNRLPAAALLEIAALAQIALWEKAGVREGLPSSQSATRDFWSRVRESPEQFKHIDNATLSRQVLEFWLRYIAWEGAASDGIFVMSALDEEAFVDTLANLVWKHRNTFSSANESSE